MKHMVYLFVILSLFFCQNAFAKQRKFLEVKKEDNYDVLFEEKTYSINDNTQKVILEENISENLMPLIMV